jgi:hypothetical protein
MSRISAAQIEYTHSSGYSQTNRFNQFSSEARELWLWMPIFLVSLPP